MIAWTGVLFVDQAAVAHVPAVVEGHPDLKPSSTCWSGPCALPQVGFTQSYGMTELSPAATVLTPEEHQAGRHLRSVGRAAAHAEVRIVDGDDNEVPSGTVGEIVCRGPNVMLGYWNRPEETAEALRDGWMHTGDAGRRVVDGCRCDAVTVTV